MWMAFLDDKRRELSPRIETEMLGDLFIGKPNMSSTTRFYDLTKVGLALTPTGPIVFDAPVRDVDNNDSIAIGVPNDLLDALARGGNPSLDEKRMTGIVEVLKRWTEFLKGTR